MNFMRHPGQRQTSPWAGERCLRTVVEGYLDAQTGLYFDYITLNATFRSVWRVLITLCVTLSNVEGYIRARNEACFDKPAYTTRCS